MSSLTARPVPSSSRTTKASNNVPATVPILSTTVGASIDSFYRSGMNALLNARLTGKQGPLFPKMHIQLPVRVIYINGIKNLRFVLEKEKRRLYDSGDYKGREWMVGGLLAVTPGVLMTPFSSVLEASNAGHMNPESMSKRWIRGLVPRTVREIIFATGLNQMSDFCEHNCPASIQNPGLRNVSGSMVAGVLSGYLSHVPHNLSTLKLLNPSVSYAEHFKSLALKYSGKTNGMPSMMDYIKTFVIPKGVTIRTFQIVGSFVLVNGTIALCNIYEISENKLMYGK